MLVQKIKEQLKEAMKNKDELRLNTLRSISSAFVNEVIALKRKPDEELSDEEALVVLRRLIKQRKDSIEQFKKGGREDLAQDEEKELQIIQEFVPEMPREEIEKIVKNKKEELGIQDKSQSGKLMGEVMKELKGKADGSIVKEIIDSLF